MGGLTVEAPQIDWDPRSQRAIDDPMAMRKAIRDAGPVVRLADGSWVVGRYEDVRKTFVETDTFLNKDSAFGFDAEDEIYKGTPIETLRDIFRGAPTGNDGETHQKVREVVARPLTVPQLKDFRPEFEQLAAGIVEKLCERGTFEVMTELAEAFGLAAVLPRIGVPPDEAAKLLPWQRNLFDLFDDPMDPEVNRIFRESLDYLLDPGLRNRVCPHSWSAHVEQGTKTGSDLGPAFFPGLMSVLVYGSLDNTINHITEMVRLFAVNPEQWNRLRENPSLVNGTVNEVVRLFRQGPLGGYAFRRADRDAKIAEIDIPKGTFIGLNFVSANRDERHYPDPEKFDIGRSNADHVGFGFARHVCPGMHLAKLEMQVLLQELIKRVETWEILDVEEKHRTVAHRVVKMHVRVRPSADVAQFGGYMGENRVNTVI
ncbi:cytochrome P450 [Phyllobacterium sp. YR531]|uniref:cytochrome P450 n=1 Tax=Phyllobacterium sp. YR531 TaxID=1144343 RepID=UPI0012F6CCE0|nr:cytochrome P450 [Phyllobacterium sp. YR531]